MTGGMELWAIVPELILATAALVLLSAGPFVRGAANNVIAAVALVAAALFAVRMIAWNAQSVFSGSYAVDVFAIFFKMYVIATTLIVLAATASRFRGRTHEQVVPSLLILMCLGMTGLSASNDFVLIALFLQLTTVASYILVGIEKEQKLAREGAMKLFLFSAACGAVMLFGMAMLFGLTGTLRLTEMAPRIAVTSGASVLPLLALVLAGYGYKITAVPFHLWAPDTYQGAATPITALLSVGPKAAAIAVLARTVVVAFPKNAAHWHEGVAMIAAVTMTLGNVLALRQRSVKRLLAYSSIAQAGYILVGVAAPALPAALFYLLVYLFMNLGAFLSVDAIERRTGSDNVDAFAGIGRRDPLVAFVLALSLLSLAGIPPLGGFLGKTLIFVAALDAGWSWLAVLLALNTALSLYYYLRVIAAMYLHPSRSEDQLSAPLSLRAVLVVLAVGSVASGVFAWPLVQIASTAAVMFKR